MFKYNKNNRLGKKLEDGLAAHKADHQAWSRRQFLGNTGLMAAGGTLLGSSSLFSWAAPLISSLYDNPDNDRVLILIRLFGGNDGLNTIVPFGDNARRFQYETILRPNIKIDEAYSLTTDDLTPTEFALPKLFKGSNEETGLYDIWNAGNMAVIHNVGYPNQSTSHFKGSDLWATGAINPVGLNASVDDKRRYSGWMGRYFNAELPAFLSAPPTVPPAIQIGSSNNLMFKGLDGNPFDLVFTNPASFYNLISNEELYNTSPNDFDLDCIRDMERVFMRQTTNNAFRYADTVKTAWKAPGNQNIPYDAGNQLGQQLSIVGRLIKGGLRTKVYQVSLGGFDTHRTQQNYHPALLQTLSSAIRTTLEGLGQDADRVMMMTFSEFGRQVTENGSAGTDHGTLAPIMLFGNKVNGRNLYGTPIDLSPEKINGGMVDFDTQDGAIDFRSVYDKVLRDWLCADAETSDTVLNPTEEAIIEQGVPEYTPCNSEGSIHCQDPLGGMIQGGCNSTVAESSTLDGYIASQVVFGYNIIKQNNNTSIELKYATKITGNIRLEILTEQGNSITYIYTDTDSGLQEEKELLLEEKYLEKGNHLHTFDATARLADQTLNNTNRYIARFSINGVSIDRNFKIN